MTPALAPSSAKAPPRAHEQEVRLSIVIPVFRAERTIRPLVCTIADCLAGVCDFEIVLVNDGSPDDSAAVCRELADTHGCVKFLNLSRNFGEHNAVMAGLNHCDGDYVVIMDDDFQNPPREILRLLSEIRKGYDVVFSQYAVKQHHFLRNLGSRLNDRVAVLLLDKPRDLYLSSFKILSRFVVNELVKYDGPYPYIDGLVLRMTRNYSRVLVTHDPRRVGRSGYTVRKLIALYLNMFTNFSILPLRLASCAGLATSALGLVLAVYFIIERIIDPSVPAGWASMIVSMFLIGGIQLFGLGMIGEYLGRLYLKDNGRPQFVVRERLNCDSPPRKSS